MSGSKIFRGNLLPMDGVTNVRKRRSFLKRLGSEFADKTSMLSRGGLYYDRFMRDLPNRQLRATFKKREFKKIKIIG